MAQRDNYYQFPIYLLDGDKEQIHNWITAHTAYKIGEKALKNGGDWSTADALERGCQELSVEHPDNILSHYHEAVAKNQDCEALYKKGNICRVRQDIFTDAFKRKPSITENYFRVFAALTAVMGKDNFKRITRERLHAGASGCKASYLPEGHIERVKFSMLQQVTKGMVRRKFCTSYWDAKTRRDTWYSYRMLPHELESAVKAMKAKKRPAARLEVDTLSLDEPF